MRKIKFLLATIMMFVGITAQAATRTVTWNASDIVTEYPWDESFTKDGITFAPGHADFSDKNFANGGTFTTASGKFTKIEVTAPYVSISGTGWSGGTWTGDASSSVSYSGDIYDVGLGQLKIVFTIEEPVAVTGVTLDKTEAALNIGETVTLAATVAPDDATDKTVTWASSDETVATVTDGVVTALAAGTATITVTTTDGAKTATCTVTVAEPTYTVTVKEGTEDAANWTVTPTSAKAGETVTITYNGTKKVKSVKAVVKAATIPVTAITLNKTETEIKVGSTETLSVTAVAPENATDKTYTWKTSDATIATVTAEGVVTAVAEGTVTIYAEANDGSCVKGNCTVNVTSAVPEYYNKLTKINDNYDDQVYLLKQLGRGRQAYNSSLTAAQAYALATYQAAIDGKPVYVIMSSQDQGYSIHYALSTDAAATEHTANLYDICNESNPVRMYYVAQ